MSEKFSKLEETSKTISEQDQEIQLLHKESKQLMINFLKFHEVQSNKKKSKSMKINKKIVE